MDYIKILRNNNKVAYKTSYVNPDKHVAADLTMRCVFAGNEKCNIGFRSLLLDADSILVLNKGTQYASCANSNQPARYFAISFDDRFVSDFNNSIRLSSKQMLDIQQNTTSLQECGETLFPFKGDLGATILHLKNNLDAGLDNELLINEYLHHCLITYNTLYNREVFKKAEQLNVLNQSTRIEVIRRLNLAKDYLHSNFDKNVNLEELADNSCLSVNHLLRNFKQAFEQTPHQYLTDIRLQKAKAMLRSTDMPVSEIVNTIGFENTSSFIRLFKKRMNITPILYRQTA